METKRGFYFKTPSNTTYYYDDITGNIESVEYYTGNSVCYGNNEYKKKEITADDVKKELISRGYDQLTLIVTQACNIRCKYCMYSGEYDNTRQHTDINMDFYTAKNALLMYFNYVKEKKKRIPLFVPQVSFYGGEPLVNFALIERVINFIKEIYNGRVIYNITTNACLLDEKKMDFFAENNVTLSISLNGDKEEHDRLRVFANGKGTYDYAFHAIKKMHEKHPQYFEKSCYVVGVYDYGTDLERIEKFFESEKLLKEKLLLYVPVIDWGTTWYDQYTEEDRKKYHDQLNRLRARYFSNVKAGKKETQVQKALFHMSNLQVINRPVNCTIQEVTSNLLPSFGTCIPGHKIAVDPYGVLHACEKVNDKMPIGTVSEGLNFEKIAEILNRYNDTLGPKCVNCPISRLCPHCYQALLDGEGKFDISRVKSCEYYIQSKINQMIQTYDLLECHVTTDRILYGGESNERIS